MIKKIKEYKPSKWVYVIFFTLPLIFTLLILKKLDNDTWYLLSEGRYIVQNGIYHIDPLSMHEGLKVTVQNWLSASIFWLAYSAFKEAGVFLLVLICNFFICFFLYKIGNVISDNNRVLSLLMMFTTSVTLAAHFIVSRPQVMSFVLLLSLIYILELYIKTDNGKYLIWLPILSLIEINLHASLWWMIFLFTLPYVIDSFKIPILRTQGYRKKPLFIAIIVALLMGLINPYGYKAITFIFTSYGDKYMHNYINELLPFTFKANNLCNHAFIIMLSTALIYFFFREGKIRVRYICLYCGTLILGLMSVKGFSHYFLVSIFPLAYFFKDLFPNSFEDLPPKMRKVLNVLYTFLGIILTVCCCVLLVWRLNNIKLSHDSEKALEVLGKFADKKVNSVYSSFNDGGVVEFYGFKPYIDPRAEVYLKVNNKKADIFKEYYELQHNAMNIEDFLNKYNFDYLIVAYNDAIRTTMQDNPKYFILYDDSNLKYTLFARNDLIDAKTRNEIIESYDKAVKEAKEKEASKKKS